MDKWIKNRKVGIALLSILVIIFLVFSVKKNLQQPDYGFFPRSDLNSIYRNYQDGQRNQAEISNNEVDEGRAAAIKKMEPYYKNFIKSLITSTLHQAPNGEFVLKFNQYAPDYENDSFSIRKDYGVVAYDSDVDVASRYNKFDFFACQYKRNDVFSREVSVKYDVPSQDFMLGYIGATYASPFGKIRRELYPLDDGNIVLKSRDGIYFLKDFCVFLMVGLSDTPMDGATEYRLEIDGEDAGTVSIPRSGMGTDIRRSYVPGGYNLPTNREKTVEAAPIPAASTEINGRKE